MTEVLVDTGPIVALLNARDEYHDWATSVMGTMPPPLLTCEAVLAEASHLVRKLRGGREAVLDLVTRGVIEIPFRIDGELLALRTLISRYANIPMSLADACLVRMAELRPRATVLTLDSDFRVYRRAARMTIPLLVPDRI